MSKEAMKLALEALDGEHVDRAYGYIQEALLTEGSNGTSADDIQYGGTHYKDMPIQPWAVMESVLTPQEFIGYLKGNIIKYSLRQGKKDSPDADKAKHYMQKLKEFQGEW
jgi:hypothetical protein